MTYKFDILKSRTVAGLWMLFVMLFPLFLLVLFHTNSLEAYLPSFLYQNTIIPVLIFILIPVYLIYNKRRLFWKIVDLQLDRQKLELTVNEEKYPLSDLQYYKFLPGSTLTSGDNRDFLILKFDDGRKLEIVPCRTSETVSRYDDFVDDFQKLAARHLPESKEKLENKAVRYTAVALLAVAHIGFFIILFLYGKLATKIIPGMLTMYGVCLPILFRRQKKGFRQHHKV